MNNLDFKDDDSRNRWIDRQDKRLLRGLMYAAHSKRVSQEELTLWVSRLDQSIKDFKAGRIAFDKLRKRLRKIKRVIERPVQQPGNAEVKKPTADQPKTNDDQALAIGCIAVVGVFGFLAFLGWASGGWERGYQREKLEERRHAQELIRQLDTVQHRNNPNSRPDYPRIGVDEPVSGYYRQDGTYVEPYYRTRPNRTETDNYSSSPNVNPYTGELGRRKPER